MSRFDDINSKFEYIEKLRQNLMDNLFEAKKKQADAKFIVHAASTILSESRECYDYCMRDIFESFVVINTSNQSLINRYNSGKLKLYFPFYLEQLNNEVWQEIQIIKPDLFQFFQKLIDDISQNTEINNTLYTYGSILELIDIVNEKKHDKLIAIKNNDQQEILIENKNFKIIMPIKHNNGFGKIHFSSDSEISLVDEFLFENNMEEVSDFCMTSLFVTRIVLNDVYNIFFNKSFLKHV